MLCKVCNTGPTNEGKDLMAETSSEPVKKCEECGADATTTRMIKGKKKHVCKSCAWVVDNLLK